MHRPLVKSVYQKQSSYFSSNTYVVGTQKNHLRESSFEHQKYMLQLMAAGIIVAQNDIWALKMGQWPISHSNTCKFPNFNGPFAKFGRPKNP